MKKHQNCLSRSNLEEFDSDRWFTSFNFPEYKSTLMLQLDPIYHTGFYKGIVSLKVICRSLLGQWTKLVLYGAILILYGISWNLKLLQCWRRFSKEQIACNWAQWTGTWQTKVLYSPSTSFWETYCVPQFMKLKHFNTIYSTQFVIFLYPPAELCPLFRVSNGLLCLVISPQVTHCGKQMIHST